MKNPESRLLQADLRKRLPVLISAQTQATRPPAGWLRHLRLALELSQTLLARRLGVSKQAYAQFEHGEVQSTISLHSLRRAAAAMDCDLVYCLVPRSSRLMSDGETHPAPDPEAVTQSGEAATIRKAPGDRKDRDPDITLNLFQTHTTL